MEHSEEASMLETVPDKQWLSRITCMVLNNEIFFPHVKKRSQWAEGKPHVLMLAEWTDEELLI